MVQTLPRINQESGYLEIPADPFLRLNPPIAKRALAIFVKYIRGKDEVRMSALARAYEQISILTDGKGLTVGNCLISRFEDKGIITVARQLQSGYKVRKMRTPIRVGESTVWDNQFKITLKPLREVELARQKGRLKQTRGNKWKASTRGGEGEDLRTFYIRQMTPLDWVLARKGVRKVKAASIPPESVRAGLPVIEDEKGKVVLIPHFRVIDRSFGVACDTIEFSPPRSMEELLLSGEVSQQDS